MRRLSTPQHHSQALRGAAEGNTQKEHVDKQQPQSAISSTTRLWLARWLAGCSPLWLAGDPESPFWFRGLALTTDAWTRAGNGSLSVYTYHLVHQGRLREGVLTALAEDVPSTRKILHFKSHTEIH